VPPQSNQQLRKRDVTATMSLNIYPSQPVPAPTGMRGSLGGAATAAAVIPFLAQRQTQTRWCWAAVSASVSGYFKPGAGWTQCRVAAAECKQPCCADGTTQLCNKDWYLEVALKRVGHHRNAFPGNVASKDVAAELNRDRPVGIRVQWGAAGGGHFLAIRGIDSHDGATYFEVTDPIYGESTVSEADLLAGRYLNSGGQWTHSYLVKR
jgi:hypothetical protein